MSRADKKIFTGLAKNLAVAYGSYSIGVSPSYYEKAYFMGEGELGDFWFDLAEKLNHVMSGHSINNLNDENKSEK